MPFELWVLAFLFLFSVACWSGTVFVKVLGKFCKWAGKAAAKQKEEWGEYGRDWEYSGDYFLRNLFK